jgi:hypothetical protein
MMDVLRAWAVPSVVGVAAGAAIAAFAPAAVLKLAFAQIATKSRGALAAHFSIGAGAPPPI